MTLASAHTKLVQAEALVREARDILALHLLKVDEIAFNTVSKELVHLQIVANNIYRRDRDAHHHGHAAEL